MKRFRLQLRSIFLVVAVFLFLLVWLAPAYGQRSKPRDAKSIQKRMQAIIHFLDSQGYKKRVSWDEHAVLVYKLAKGRVPTSREFFLLDAFRQDIGISRSTALSIALRGNTQYPTWEQCRAFLKRIDVSRFQSDQSVRETARKLAAVPKLQVMGEIMEEMAAEMEYPRRLPETPQSVPNREYNIYFGYLHAHSELSDGTGSPLEAYTYAREQGQLDFFSLTDHGELLIIWPWDNKWEQLVHAAEATYVPGTYVTLWGFEWSNPILGHINVLNTADYTNAIFTFWLTSLYDWIGERPSGFGRYNHPGDYDLLSLEFFYLALYPVAVLQMVGIETWNGNRSFDDYYYSGNWLSNSPLSYWDVGNRNWWYLGPLGGQDNHNRLWGTLNDFRTAVLAEELTRDHIVDAYLNRRYYATEDKDLYLDFRCYGYPMGSRLPGVPRQFDVTACDGSGDTFQEVSLYRNGSLLQSEEVSGNCVQVSFTDPYPGVVDYYYVIVRQDDDNDGNGRNDEAISSPIWIY